MNQRKSFLMGILVTMFAISMFWVGTAFASTGCFTDTNGNPYEVAICWLKANKIVGGTTFNPNNAATRAVVAQWLYKQVQIPPTTGAFQITVGPASWVLNSGAVNGSMTYFTDAFRMTASSGWTNVQVSPQIPNLIYGRIPELTAVEICSSGTPSQYIDNAGVQVYGMGATSPGLIVNKYNQTDRTTNGCFKITLDTPLLLGNSRWVSLYLNSRFVSSGNLDVYRATFFLKPSAYKAMPISDQVPASTTGYTEGAAP
jgi:hypothetical protein